MSRTRAIAVGLFGGLAGCPRPPIDGGTGPEAVALVVCPVQAGAARSEVAGVRYSGMTDDASRAFFHRNPALVDQQRLATFVPVGTAAFAVTFGDAAGPTIGYRLAWTGTHAECRVAPALP